MIYIVNACQWITSNFIRTVDIASMQFAAAIYLAFGYWLLHDQVLIFIQPVPMLLLWLNYIAVWLGLSKLFKRFKGSFVGLVVIWFLLITFIVWKLPGLGYDALAYGTFLVLMVPYAGVLLYGLYTWFNTPVTVKPLSNKLIYSILIIGAIGGTLAALYL